MSFFVVVGFGCFGCGDCYIFFQKELRCDVALWELSFSLSIFECSIKRCRYGCVLPNDTSSPVPSMCM